MEMKRKLLAIWMVLLLSVIPFSCIGAGETNIVNTSSQDMISLEIGVTEEDGNIEIESFTITEGQLEEFKERLDQLMNEIESAEDMQEVENIINNLNSKGGIIFSIIMKFISRIKNIFNRELLISSGHGYKLNILKKTSLKMHKRVIFWHYSPNKLINSRSIILKPLSFQMKSFRGRQFGLVSKFNGLYLFVSHRFPQKSYSFMIGSGKQIFGFQL